MPSFDIISEVDNVEIKNAVDNSIRELDTHFDFRGVESSIELNKETVKIKSESEFQIDQIVAILRNNLAKRGVDANSLERKTVNLSGKTASQDIEFKQGIDQATAKKLVKAVKDSKIKVQVSIQGDKLRVTGKKRDDLQATMALVREQDLGQPFQFDNSRD
ncbi:putative nucleotide-binding protein [Photobacterium damselae subsp. piscicida]|uniref:Nucleotide-binding protein IC627_08460 n=1 Tax=Photobacterium damsela subsp. piscicida TaxID=38294 RepID=A0A1V1VB32_PHODP|nr:YajQ family cyclic di-GMP-binding protein [Photobacterium damselae]MBE8129374.1 YajQ family cyclic di-GMP-binding protein [Photobacterium damselae subsp. piscicida]MDP2514333.1 YajQ family cyclic di-GMP-binding protein [Photobacterium damselae subsp. piscicida]MDP2558924.1 YajQ family cyclic di-GMP-binding protein [Photobacterium damselae subsp. piscicida]MDP2569709.1 YajQ family cyclic di-GMP-binding protein [Photobacterium damselae subsp. piscicida]PSV66869.1 YajQ family cyclic di-GMP-bin